MFPQIFYGNFRKYISIKLLSKTINLVNSIDKLYSWVKHHHLHKNSPFIERVLFVKSWPVVISNIALSSVISVQFSCIIKASINLCRRIIFLGFINHYLIINPLRELNLYLLIIHLQFEGVQFQRLSDAIIGFVKLHYSQSDCVSLLYFWKGFM